MTPGGQEKAPPEGKPAQRIAIVDDSTAIRDLGPTLFPASRTTVFASVEDLIRAVAATTRPGAAAPHAAFDVVVLDLQIQGPDGSAPLLQGAAAVRATAGLGIPILIYTSEPRTAVLAACLAQGAAGIAHKNEPLNVLVDAVYAVAQGRTVITPALAHLAEFAADQGELTALTDRQIEALHYQARGYSHQQVASRMGVSLSSAQGHWYAVAARFREYLRDHSPADLERLLGLAPGDVLYPGGDAFTQAPFWHHLG